MKQRIYLLLVLLVTALLLSCQNKAKEAYEEGRLEQEIYNRNLYDKARSQL